MSDSLTLEREGVLVLEPSESVNESAIVASEDVALDAAHRSGNEIDGPTKPGPIEKALGLFASENRCTWLSQAEGQLRQIAKLPPGWDSHGGERPDPAILSSGISLLYTIAKDFNVLAPHINPTPSGGVQFEWEKGELYLEIELLTPTEARFYFCDQAKRTEDQGILLAEAD